MRARQRRLISMASFVTTISARLPNWANCTWISPAGMSASGQTMPLRSIASAPQKSEFATGDGCARGRSTARAAGGLRRRSLRPDSATLRAVAAEVKKIFALRALYRRYRQFDRRTTTTYSNLDRSGSVGVFRRRTARRLRHHPGLFGGTAVGYRTVAKVAIRSRSWCACRNANCPGPVVGFDPVPANSVPGNKTVVELGEVVHVTEEAGSPAIFRRDGRYAEMVMAELPAPTKRPSTACSMWIDWLLHRLGQIATADCALSRSAQG